MILNTNNEIFVIYINIQKQEKMPMDFIKKAQIKVKSKNLLEAKVEALLFNKAFTEVLAKYFNYSKVFLVKN